MSKITRINPVLKRNGVKIIIHSLSVSYKIKLTAMSESSLFLVVAEKK